MKEKSKHSPQRRRFIQTGVGATCASGVLLATSKTAQSAIEEKPEGVIKGQKGYQAESEHVQTYYQRARF